MGEEGKQEQPPKAESKPEEKAAEEKKEEKPKDEKQEAKPPSTCVLFVDLHCMGCAKKIERYVMKMKGVEGVVIDMDKSEVTIKGIVDPQAICNIITKKAKRRANVISPLPTAEGEAAPAPEVVTSQVSAPVSVELNVNMHCEACAEQLKKKILKMKGVQAAVTDFSTGKITVTGTMDANKLVDYVYRCTKKQAKIVPQPEPEPEKKEEETKETDKPKEEEAPAKAEEENPAADEAKKEENGCEDKNNNSHNKEAEKGSGGNELQEQQEEEAKKGDGIINVDEEEGMKKMMHYYQPFYVIERIPPPQLFSDENPNACCIS
ncbi:hypothetical protein PIB30_086824 [Stylosanthes scabra]|uniref:HMA domain-containing protein n=1 Tax=Stylosanthes scabra TaxID=79078 RepID=A0ABU6YSS0_9FABA|nr:hypothetical protein [Stylosanthes scabra]